MWCSASSEVSQPAAKLTTAKRGESQLGRSALYVNQAPHTERARKSQDIGSPRLLVGDTALGRRAHVLDVLEERAARRLQRRRRERRAPARQLVARDLELEHALLRVDQDAIAVAHQRDRPAVLRLGRHVPDQEAV